MTGPRFVLASGNAHKLKEFAAILAPFAVEPMPAGIKLPPEGTVSFLDNAVGKARGLAAALVDGPGGAAARGDRLAAAATIVIADDSGLEVEGLDWAPGVTSARYAGEGATDRDNYELLLRRLEGVVPAARRARFVCVLAAALSPDLTPATATGPALVTARGEWWGTITREPHGGGGFGYDPVFLPDGSDLTVAEMPQSVKDQASHRALAGRALLDRLRKEGVLGAPHR